MNRIGRGLMVLGIGSLLATTAIAQDESAAQLVEEDRLSDFAVLLDDGPRDDRPDGDRERGERERGDRPREGRGPREERTRDEFRRAPDAPRPDGPPRDGDRGRRGPEPPLGGPGPHPEVPGRPDGPGPRPGHPPHGPGFPPGDWQSLEKKDPEMFKLLQSERDLDRESHDLAHEYRKAPTDQQESIKEKLQQAVTKHFEARQQRRSLEIKRLEDEVKRLREGIDRRTQAQQAIITDRVAELLGQESGF